MFLWVEMRDVDGRFVAVKPDGLTADPSAHVLDAKWKHQRDEYEFALLGAEVNRGPFEPIVPIRDLPDDAWPPIRSWMIDSWFLSASWFTAAELQAVDWSARIRYRTYDSVVGGSVDPLGEPVVHALDDLDEQELERIRGVLFPEGWNEIVPEVLPSVVDLPLAKAAPGLHALMLKMVALRPDQPQAVRAVYAFDQLPGRRGRPLPAATR